MANLVESVAFTPGIYQLETSDPVLGGPDGIDNVQAKQLANRTQWLKEQVELRATIEALNSLSLALNQAINGKASNIDLNAAINSLNVQISNRATFSDLNQDIQESQNYLISLINQRATQAALNSFIGNFTTVINANYINQSLPNNLKYKFFKGTSSGANANNGVVTFVDAFPNACLFAFGVVVGSSAGGWSCQYSGQSAQQAIFTLSNQTGYVSGVGFLGFAVGY